MRVLGIDYGERRIGLAVSDPGGTLALPVGTLERRGWKRDLAALVAVIEERQVERIVVGLPLHLDGREGDTAAAARRFAERLAEAASLPVETVDERWTTREAERALAEGGRRGRKRRAVVDAVAATLLLRSFLERRAGAAGGTQ